MTTKRWEYCLLTCTPMSGLDEEGVRIAYQVVGPDAVRQLEIRIGEPSPVVAIGRLLNELGREGWELVAYDTSTNRGVFKRPALEPGDIG
jgi:hypothetical protein